MSEDKYSTKRSRKSAESLSGRATGNKLPMFKIKKKVTELFILTPKDIDESVVFTTFIHKYTQGNGKNFKVLKQCASPAFTKEKDDITDLGWDVRNAYAKSDSKSLSEFWKNLVADSDDHILVLDINDVEAGPQIFKMPRTVYDVVMPALNICMEENDGDLHDYCHPEEGKILVIETNGEEGFQRKYTDVFFDLDKPASLFGDKIVSESEFDSILNKRPSMEKSQLQPKFSKEEFEDYINFCYEKAEELGIDLDNLGGEEKEVNYSDKPRSSGRAVRQEEDTPPRRSSRQEEDTPPRRSSRQEEAKGRVSNRASVPEEEEYDVESDIVNENEYEAEEPRRSSRASGSSSGEVPSRGGRRPR